MAPGDGSGLSGSTENVEEAKRFLDVFSGMRGPLDGLGRQGFGPCGPETQAFKEVEWRLAMVPDSADPLKTSRKQ